MSREEKSERALALAQASLAEYHIKTPFRKLTAHRTYSIAAEGLKKFLRVTIVATMKGSSQDM